MKIRSASHPRPPREPRRDRVRVRALDEKEDHYVNKHFHLI